MEHDKCERKGLGKTELTLEVGLLQTLCSLRLPVPFVSPRAPLPREFQTSLPSKPNLVAVASLGARAEPGGPPQALSSCVWTANPTPTLPQSL